MIADTWSHVVEAQGKIKMKCSKKLTLGQIKLGQLRQVQKCNEICILHHKTWLSPFPNLVFISTIDQKKSLHVHFVRSCQECGRVEQEQC
jgi:hypothetical protein